MSAFSLKKKQIEKNGESRILIVDRQPLIAYGVKKLLSNYPYLQVVAHAEDGLSALSIAKKKQPNLLILDPDLSGLDGLDVVTQVKRRLPQTLILLYFTLREEHRVQNFVKAGVNGFAVKSQPLKQLLNAIHSVIKSGCYFDPCITIENTQLPGVTASLELPKLSPRERQILKLIAEGLRNKDIAVSFSISVKTVESHRLNLMRKLDAHNVVDLIRWARRFQLT